MNAAASLPALCCFRNYERDVIPSGLFRPNRRRGSRRFPSSPHRTTKPPPPPPPDRTIELSVDVDDILDRAVRLYRSSEVRLHRYLSSGADAFRDLSTSVRIDTGHRIVFSCRRSSILFFQSLLLWSLAAAVVFLALAELRVLPWWRSDRLPVVRRDRSLGGREVVVERRRNGREAEERSFRASVGPLSPPKGAEMKVREAKRMPKREVPPKWWRDTYSVSPVSPDGKQEGQREANRLVRAIMDSRMSGKDFKDDDIIQLRRICKVSGATVSFETENTRDSFYRAAVDLVLDSCSRVIHPAANVLVDGEEAEQFICGLAYNIGLESVDAARLVRAAVAARTRASFLQTWALEIQGRRSEALEELSKISRIYLVFPPEEHSPEMEMVAGGLKKYLGVEQRAHLLDLFKGICGAENQRIAAEALGLLYERKSLIHSTKSDGKELG